MKITGIETFFYAIYINISVDSLHIKKEIIILIPLTIIPLAPFGPAGPCSP